jgi:hypothetical protein
MFRILGFLLKVTVFSVLVLVIGNLVHWRGRTVSDQVRTNISHAERAAWVGVDEVKHWAGRITQDTKAGATARKKAASAKPEAAVRQDELQGSERQKLRALIEELNHSQVKD